jgi:hypothetical protein
MLHNQNFAPDDLEILANAESFNSPSELPLEIGEIVMLNSGSPPMTVVDLSEAMDCPGLIEDPDTGSWVELPHVMSQFVMVSWRSKRGVEEQVFPRECVHRVVVSVNENTETGR